GGMNNADERDSNRVEAKPRAESVHVVRLSLQRRSKNAARPLRVGRSQFCIAVAHRNHRSGLDCLFTHPDFIALALMTDFSRLRPFDGCGSKAGRGTGRLVKSAPERELHICLGLLILRLLLE